MCRMQKNKGLESFIFCICSLGKMNIYFLNKALIVIFSSSIFQQTLVIAIALMMGTVATKSMTASSSTINPVHYSTLTDHHQCNNQFKSGGQLMNIVLSALPLPFDKTVHVSLDIIPQIRLVCVPIKFMPTLPSEFINTDYD